ncbi:histidine kinase N-terminal 7TM domain-containing protein [Candidatus Oscillochloris fontis]|uniref:sensor histidine kinase n=1 Tax=Candidatus Oscillochloris fontis TaxID=2496868 RepID=UPI00101B7860|nr:histidine kinase N-terminal 7TM domain-containing protein [Candidatus Oscillochloris fontis]
MGAFAFIALHFIITLIALLIAAYAWRRRYYRSSQPFAILLTAIAVWTTCRALAAASPTPDGTIFWSLVQHLGILALSPAWLLISISYSEFWLRWRRPLQIGIFVLPIIFFVIALTNDLHHLWWTSVTVDTSRGFLWPVAERGIFFWVHAVYAYLCLLTGIVLLSRAVFKAGPINRGHAWMLLFAAFSPAIGNVTYLSGLWTPWNDDPTPIMAFVGALLGFYATIHFRVIDLAPLVEREVLAALPDGMVVLNRQMVVSEINAEAISLLQLPLGQMIGRSLLSLLADQPRMSQIHSVLVDGPSPQTHQIVIGEGDTLQALELRLRPLQASSGARVGMLLLLRDVSERAKAEQARAMHMTELSLLNQVARAANLATETERLIRVIAEAIVRNGPWERVAVGLVPKIGGQIDIVADLGTQMGQSYEGSLVRSQVSMELLALMMAGKSSQFALDDSSAAETSIMHLMRREQLQHVLVVPLLHQANPLGVLVLGNSLARPHSPALLHLAETIGELITDASVRTRLYDEVRTADRLKSAFLATVSHELRTPLTSIIGYTEMLQRGLYGPLGDRMGEPLGHMRTASGTLLRLITDILDFSRMEAGHLKVDLTPVEPLRTIRSVAGQFQPLILQRSLDLYLDLPDHLPYVHANSMRLEQVLTNLIGNAIKFTDQGGITVSASHHADRLRISVSDTGIGIAHEHQEAIFLEFRRVENAGRHAGGAGLGLAISRRLVELMGGTIGLHSTPGEGSTFFIELPICAVPADSPPTVMSVPML